MNIIKWQGFLSGKCLETFPNLVTIPAKHEILRYIYIVLRNCVIENMISDCIYPHCVKTSGFFMCGKRGEEWTSSSGRVFCLATREIEHLLRALCCTSITAVRPSYSGYARVRIVAIAYVDASFWGALCPSIYRFIWQGSALVLNLKWFLAGQLFKSQTLENHCITLLTCLLTYLPR